MLYTDTIMERIIGIPGITFNLFERITSILKFTRQSILAVYVLLSDKKNIDYVCNLS